MNYLTIDCSNGLYVYLNVGGREFCKFDTTKKQSAELLTDIDKLLSDAKISIRDIDVIGVNVGPGSFTGIRVAISSAKGLAIGTKAKVVTFTSFQTIENLPNNNYTILVDGFGDNIYYKVKKFGKEFLGCSNIDNIKELTDGTEIYTNSLSVAEKYKNINVTLAKYNVKVVMEEKINKQDYILTNQICPLYLRASQAEIERLKNGK